MEKVAIFGAAGSIGTSVGAELEKRGIPFRAVGRTRAKLEAGFGAMRHCEITTADLADVHAATEAARGADTILYTVGVPYGSFQLHPRLMAVTVEAAAASGVKRLAVVSSVYGYGVPRTRRVAETHPREPAAVKGRYRREQEDVALSAGGLVVRLPDFYGPYDNNSLAHEIFRSALRGKTANWLGPASTPHEFLFVPDAGPVLADLIALPDCYGQAWNLGGAGEITGAEFIGKVYRAAGRAPKFRIVGRTALKVAGWFSPLMRELPEMAYLQETPVILDDSKLAARLGALRKTPYEEGIRKTVDWMRAAIKLR
jgi:nucleoside-diphosphate-sugar epimerase